MRIAGGLALLVVSVAVCLATSRWWLAVRRKDDYSYIERNNAMRFAGFGVLGIILAFQLLLNT